MNVQWYPGHMTKTKRMMAENISLVDVVVELLDARIPFSSKNPDIDTLGKNKFRIIVLNKVDLADSKKTEEWVSYFENQGFKTILVNSINGNGMSKVTAAAKELMQEKIDRQKARGRLFMPIRSMIVGIPNVGKSTFINKFVGKASTKTGDKPGVTRGKQWIKIKKDFELLDTPGILWPKFEDKSVGLKLAFTGAINDDILDLQTLASEFITLIRKCYPNVLEKRYGVNYNDDTLSAVVLEEIAIKRGFVKKGSEPDVLRASKIMFDEFRGGKLGNLTIESPPVIEVVDADSESNISV